MSRLSIVKYPAPVLRKKAAPVDRVTPELAAFIEEMGAMMYDANGVGLAAPQVGIALRIIVVDIGKGLQAVLNPEIIAQEGTQTGVEGCLSLPDLHGDVTRAQRITVRGVSMRGKKITLTGEDFWARAMQHEIDHLHGILFTDRVLPETLRWVTDDTDANGDYIERPTTLEDALRVFQELARVG
jgi:peptide deformylase